MSLIQSGLDTQACGSFSILIIQIPIELFRTLSNANVFLHSKLRFDDLIIIIRLIPVSHGGLTESPIASPIIILHQTECQTHNPDHCVLQCPIRFTPGHTAWPTTKPGPGRPLSVPGAPPWVPIINSTLVGPQGATSPAWLCNIRTLPGHCSYLPLAS